MRGFVYALAMSMATVFSASAEEQPLPADGSVRQFCKMVPNNPAPECSNVPYGDAKEVKTLFLPPAVETAYRDSYGKIIVTSRTISGTNEYSFCGGFLVDKDRRLVVTAQHCLPTYREQLQNGTMTFRGISAQFVAGIPEADLALLEIASVPDGMEPVVITEAVVGEQVFARSQQTTSLFAPDSDQTHIGFGIFFEGEVSISSAITSKGVISIGASSSGEEGMLPSFTLRPSQYEMLRMDGVAIEQGFSGGPIFNIWGAVVGVSSRMSPNATYISSAKNLPRLLSLYSRPRL